jgi:hypothetical protein
MRGFRTAGYRVVFFYVNRGALSRWGHRKRDSQTLESLDAYCGVTLWRKEFPSPAKGFDPILTGSRLIVQIGEELLALDSSTGDKVLTYAEAGTPQGGVECGGVLVVACDAFLRGLDLQTGKRLGE